MNKLDIKVIKSFQKVVDVINENADHIPNYIRLELGQAVLEGIMALADDEPEELEEQRVQTSEVREQEG